MEALKVAMGKGADEVLVGRMLLYDASTCRFRTVKLRGRNRACDICGDAPRLKTLQAVEGVAHDGCAASAGADPHPDLPPLAQANVTTCQLYSGAWRPGAGAGRAGAGGA